MRIDRRLAGASMLRMSLRRPIWKPFGGCRTISSMEQCLFYLWLHWIAREKVLALHRRHLGAEKRAVTSELPPLPTDSSAAFVSAVRVQYITYQHITGTFRFEIRLAQLVFT